MNKYIYNNKTYTIELCTLEDIPSHVEKVSLYWNRNEERIQVDRMINAVENGTAIKLVDEDNETKVFAYYEQISESESNGIALWWSSIRLFAILGMWFRRYTFNHYVYITPHKEGLATFEFLVENQSIRNFKKKGTPLVLNLYSIKTERIVKLYESMNVKEL